MNRAELRALVAELNDWTVDARLELCPRVVTRDNFEGSRYQVNMTCQVTQPLYFNPRDDMSPEVARILIREEIFTFLHSCAEATLARLRHERLTAFAARNPVARQLLRNPLAVPYRGFRPASPDEPSALMGLPTARHPGHAPTAVAAPGLWHTNAPESPTSPATLTPSLRPTALTPQPVQGQSRIPEAEVRRHLMLRPPVTVPIEHGMPRRPVNVPEAPPRAEKTVEPEPATLWERLEES